MKYNRDRMAKIVPSAGLLTIEIPAELQGAGMRQISGFSVSAPAGVLGSVIHGMRIGVDLHVASASPVHLSMGAADALQLAEEIRAAVHRRDDIAGRDSKG